jgi:hypothetical protein
VEVQPVVDDLAQAAQECAHEVGRRARALGRVAQAAVDQPLELVVHALDALERFGTGGVDLDVAEPRRRGLGDDEVDRGLERRAEPFVPWPVVGVICVGDRLGGGVDQRVDRREEAGMLVGEVAVEGAARDARELEQVGDAGLLVAALGHRRDRGAEEPLALVTRDGLGGVARTGAKPARAQLLGIAPWGRGHGWDDSAGRA